MAREYKTIPFYFFNSSSFLPTELWFGHYSSKDKDAGVSTTMYYHGKPVDPGLGTAIGMINIVKESMDYWSLFFRYQGLLYGNPDTWYRCEASMDDPAIEISIKGTGDDFQANLWVGPGNEGWAGSWSQFGVLGSVPNLMKCPDYEKK